MTEARTPCDKDIAAHFLYFFLFLYIADLEHIVGYDLIK